MVEPEAQGASLAALLAGVDTSTLSDHDLLDTIADWERVASWVAAKQLAACADFARRPARVPRPDDDLAALSATWARPGNRTREFADDEVAAELRISRGDAAARIELGCALERLPVTRSALSAGRIDLRRARVLADGTKVLDAETAREVELALIGQAERLPAGRLVPKVSAAVLSADPAAAQVRATRARSDRRVQVFPADDGMADLWAHLPAVEAMSIKAAITAAAKASHATRSPDDKRTMDQRRADEFAAPFLDALETGRLSGQRLARRRGRPVELQVLVSASTLLGADDSPAVLAGYGPITAETARELAPDARMRRPLTDPLSGTVLDVGTTVYRPPAPLLRHVEVRDQLCSYPGCGWPAEASDFDHTVPFPEGPTSAANGRMRCRRHHRLKQSPGVRVDTHEDGTTHWTMPTGHVHEVQLPDLRPSTQRDPSRPTKPEDQDPQPP